jgi:ribonuclease Z
MKFPPESALRVGTQIHTAPEAFGKIMSEIRPRMAVAYHFFKDPDTTAGVNDRIRKTYDGPLSLAEDFMVWNVTRDEIKTRMAVVEERTWAPPPASPAALPSMADRKAFDYLNTKLEYSDFIADGVWPDVEPALREIYKEASRKLGREFPYPETTK